MFDSLIKLFTHALSIWDSKEKTKYTDKILSLKRDYYDEYAKPIGVRNDDELARIERGLRDLVDAFTASSAPPGSAGVQ